MTIPVPLTSKLLFGLCFGVVESGRDSGTLYVRLRTGGAEVAVLKIKYRFLFIP